MTAYRYRRCWTDDEYGHRLKNLEGVYHPAIAAILAEDDSKLADLRPVLYPRGFRHRIRFHGGIES